MPDRKMLEWAESYRDSEEIGPHGLHDSTVGDLASALLALEADARRWRAVRDRVFTSGNEKADEAADRLAAEQEATA